MDDSQVTLVPSKVLMTGPESKTGFPMTHDNWNKIKNRVADLKIKSSFYRSFGWKDLGMIFFGVAITTLISFWLPGYSEPHQFIIASIICTTSFIFGAILIFFHYQLNAQTIEHTNTKVSHVVEIMELIEIDDSKEY